MERSPTGVRAEVHVILYVAFILFLSSTLLTSQSSQQPHTYIIHVSKPHKPSIFPTHQYWYTSTLASLPPSPQHPTKLLYTYDHTLHGFAARLTPFQASTLHNIHGVLSVIQERKGHLHTTRSPHFLGLTKVSRLSPNLDYADDVIIGMLDTGIWPECRSFSDEGLSPVPARWKGGCVSGSNFSTSSCNKKLIGAKFFCEAYEAEYGPIDEEVDSRSPRDTDGHGTHTASTAAGSPVKDAVFYNDVVCEARGMASKARIAAYKICWIEECSEADILARIDEAVDDGVDVISIECF